MALVGDLGAGKTTFIQGLAEGLGIKERINSPTFIILREYSHPDFMFYHVDLYRLEGDFSKELENLGLTTIMAERQSVVVIEWADKIKDLLPQNTKWLNFEEQGDERIITIQA